MSSQGLRELLASFLWRITLHENKIEVKIGKGELRQQLESGGKTIPADPLSEGSSVAASDVISLTVEAKRKRCGGEVHLIVPPNSGVSPEHPKLARTHIFSGRQTGSPVFKHTIRRMHCDHKPIIWRNHP